MTSAALRWTAAAAVLLGFLLFFLIPGNSALNCNFAVSVKSFSMNTWDKYNIYMDTINATCYGDDNACVDARVKLLIGRQLVLIRYTGCAHWDSSTGSESSISGDQHVIRSNISYCFHDICNPIASPKDVSLMHEEEQALETSNSNYCYRLFNHNQSEPVLEKVRCQEGSENCSQLKEASIAIGSQSDYAVFPIKIRTCTNTSYAVSWRQFFGPLRVRIREESWFSDCRCPQKKIKHLIQRSRRAAAASGSAVSDNSHSGTPSPAHKMHAIRSVHHGDPKPVSPSGDAHHSDGGDGAENAGPSDHGSEHSSSSKHFPVQPGPLLVALGITIFAMW